MAKRPRRVGRRLRARKIKQLSAIKITPKAHQTIPGVSDVEAYYFGHQSLWFLQKHGLIPNVCFNSDSLPPPQGAVIAKGMKNVLLKGACGPGTKSQQIAHVKESIPMYGKHSVLVTLVNGKKYRVYSMMYTPNQGLYNTKYAGF